MDGRRSGERGKRKKDGLLDGDGELAGEEVAERLVDGRRRRRGPGAPRVPRELDFDGAARVVAVVGDHVARVVTVLMRGAAGRTLLRGAEAVLREVDPDLGRAFGCDGPRY